MTRNVTVVRNNEDLKATLDKLAELKERYRNVSLSDTGSWTNQNLSFARALGDMIEQAEVITEGALRRDECRGAHYKPEFEIPAPDSDEPDVLRQQAERWCRAFKEKNDKWLKTTIAEYSPDGPKYSYEEVDTSLIPPRPRTYGLKGAEIIVKVWREMGAQKREPAAVATA
jgi:succinate dehydrogenase / fumarate reductase flavoprotein subunit